jgi:hypothetical protein
MAARKRSQLSLEDRLDLATRRLARPQPRDLPQQAEIARAVIQSVGGPEVFARKLADLMLSESTPKDTLRRVWENVTYMLRYVEETQGDGDDLSLADDGELKALARDLYRDELQQEWRRDQAEDAQAGRPGGGPAVDPGAGPGAAPDFPAFCAGDGI